MSQSRKTRDSEQMIERARKRLRKRAKRGLRGYPIATVALYGPNDTRATKLTVGIVPAEDAEATDLRRWFSEGADIRNDAGVAEEVLAFIHAAGARSIVMTDRIIGCPHECPLDVYPHGHSLRPHPAAQAGAEHSVVTSELCPETAKTIKVDAVTCFRSEVLYNLIESIASQIDKSL
jgi:hypothetical protein